MLAFGGRSRSRGVSEGTRDLVHGFIGSSSMSATGYSEENRTTRKKVSKRLRRSLEQRQIRKKRYSFVSWSRGWVRRIKGSSPFDLEVILRKRLRRG